MRKLALGLALATGLGSTPSTADDSFTAADVLEMETAHQDAYIETSVAMAGVMASKSRSPALKCINDWYFAQASERAERNDEFRQAFTKNSEYHPGIVIAAVIERACGSLNFSK